MPPGNLRLTPRQQHAVQRARNCRRLGLFWPCGAGKSIAALSIALDAWKASRILILARKNNLRTWELEGRKVGVNLTPIISLGGKTALDRSCVVSHDAAARHWRTIVRQPFHALIVDESYAVKNPKSQRSKAAYEISRRIPYTLILNALPFTDQGYVDIFGQFKVLDCGETYGVALTRFREFYQYPHPAGFGWEDDPDRLAILTRKASRNADFMRADEIDLPLAVSKTYSVEWDPVQRQIFNALRDNWRAAFEGVEIDTKFAISRIVKLHQLGGGFFAGNEKRIPIPTNKPNALLSLLELIGNNSVVIWCAYNAEVEFLALFLRKHGYKASSYTGKHDVFPQGWRVLVAQQRCGVGLNDLTNTPYAIYYSKYWSYYYLMQSMGRTSRISSKHTRAYYFSLEIPSSVDSLVEKNLQQKNDKAAEFAAIGKEMIYGQ